jgi:hypothetical protein
MIAFSYMLSGAGPQAALMTVSAQLYSMKCVELKEVGHAVLRQSLVPWQAGVSTGWGTVPLLHQAAIALTPSHKHGPAGPLAQLRAVPSQPMPRLHTSLRCCYCV